MKNLGPFIAMNSIFHSFSGEIGVVPQGTQMLFIRLSGCNLRCSWCDTTYAQNFTNPKFSMTQTQLVRKVEEYGIKHLLFTGGEPLCQSREIAPVVKELHDKGYHISFETNGSIFPNIYGVSGWIVDYKLPSSGMLEDMLKVEDYPRIIPTGQRGPAGVVLKMVVANRLDFTYGVTLASVWVNKFGLGVHYSGVKIAMSPGSDPESETVLDGKTLGDWIIESGVREIILSVQIHKLLKFKEDQES